MRPIIKIQEEIKLTAQVPTYENVNTNKRLNKELEKND